jgi:hypothetical protein
MANFATVFPAELKNIGRRRKLQLGTDETNFALPDFQEHLIAEERQSEAFRTVLSEMAEPSQADSWKTDSDTYRPGLVGLALSGGGIRSATFNLGILQVLNEVGLFKCIDYMSTVSGGGYLGTYVSTYFSNPHRIDNPGEDPFPFAHERGTPESAEMRHLRNNSNYLAPGGFLDALAIPIVLARGIIINFTVILPYLLLAAVLMDYTIVEEQTGSYSYGSIWNAGFLSNSFDYNFPLTTLLLIIIALFMLSYPARQHRLQRKKKGISYLKEARQKYLSFATILCILTAVVAFVELQPLAITALMTDYREDLTVGTVLVSVISNMYSYKLLDHLGSLAGKIILFVLGLLGFVAVWLIMLLLAITLIKSQQNPSSLLNPMQYAYLTIAALAFLYTWFFVDINFTGIHKFYRDRLSTAFVDRFEPEPAGDGPGTRTPQYGRESAAPDMEDLNSDYCPYHLINAAINVDRVDEDDAFRNGRHSSFFIFSKEYCGGVRTGYFPTGEWRQKTGNSIDIATAMAISAAAVAPNMGKQSIGILTFILSLLNLRLNYWLANPRRLLQDTYPWLLAKVGKLRKWYEHSANRAGPRYLFREMLGKLRADNRLVNLSDGGHIENLGVYELLRRQCRLIVAGDGEADPGLSFDGLAEVIRMARIDFGYKIEMEGLDEIRAGAQQYALGKIYYNDTRIGHLIYLKLNLGGDYNLQATLSEGQYRTSSERDDDYLFDDNAYIARYRERYPSFPHQSTGDQFFDETQFECYRALGHQVARAALMK